ncbi:MAG: hypothetical protein H0A76_08420 [Candidatus Thiodubiliella endoseptemdiera]|uniref:Uncharacterized protein n=1 Tax=Candidatus Thiodubiliella endoseptemdiera TaxID=2738886 RepID=A0A853F1W6_9GAMM|nr:hypothetical protein [Candidatus Thiodubiliella endoseptemdiera]
MQSMLKCLYKNYDSSKSNEFPYLQNVQLLNQNQTLQNSNKLYFSKLYPSSELPNALFGDSFYNKDQLLADIEVFNLEGEKQEIEDFFSKLGVKKNTKLLVAYFKKEHSKIDSEKIITWCLKSKEYKSAELRGIFNDHLISNNKKIDRLVNDKTIDYRCDIFKKYEISSAHIDSLLLDIESVEDFDELSAEKITNILYSLPKRPKR